MRIFFSVGEPSGDLHGANPIRLSRTMLHPSSAAALLGEHTAAVLSHVLGLSAEEIERLVADGVCR